MKNKKWFVKCSAENSFRIDFRNHNDDTDRVETFMNLQDVYNFKYEWAFNDKNVMSQNAFFNFYQLRNGKWVELNDKFFIEQNIKF